MFCYLRGVAGAIINLVDAVEAAIEGDLLDPAALWTKLSARYALIGVQGIIRMAMSGLDVACWDALAVAAEMPLARMLGAEPKPILAYNCRGLGLVDDLGALAAALNIKMLSHLFPEVSAHLLAAMPTGHYLEYVDWANPLLREPLTLVGGHAAAPDRPGNGQRLVWDEKAVKRYLLT